MEGTICAVLAGTMFKVRLPNGHEVLAHISGKMRKRFIKIVVGDKVRMEMSPYDMTKARITFRIGELLPGPLLLQKPSPACRRRFFSLQ